MTESLPDLSKPFALRADTVRDFRRDGHVIVHALAAEHEVAAFRPALLEAGEATRHERRPLAERDTYGKAFLQMFNLWRHNEVAKAFVFARRFARVAAELMEVSGVRLYHDQALFKEPGGGATPWHQDQFYWPLATTHTITLWMPLVPVTTDMGLMTFASGSHALGSLGDFARAPTGPLAAGDASFHAGFTLHSTPPNRTATMREAMTVIYFEDGARVGPLDHPNRRFDRDVWLRGCEPGDLAAGRLNPVLYTRAAG